MLTVCTQCFDIETSAHAVRHVADGSTMPLFTSPSRRRSWEEFAVINLLPSADCRLPIEEPRFSQICKRRKKRKQDLRSNVGDP